MQVLIAVLGNKKLRTVTNVLICNLSVADILFALGIPFIAITRLTEHWILGDVVCKVVTYVQFISGVCSILTMTMISVDRFTRVCYVGKFKMRSRELNVSLTVIWITSMSFPIPVVISQTLKTITTETEEFTFCGVKWFDGFHPELFISFMVAIFFVIPLVITSCLYLKIWLTVRGTSSKLPVTMEARKKKSADKEVRMVKMFLCIVILFVVMWLPFFVLSFLGVHYRQITSTQLTSTLILALANTCQNPVIYGFFNYRLRDEFKAILDTVCCKKRSSAYATNGVELPSMGSRSRNNSSTI